MSDSSMSDGQFAKSFFTMIALLAIMTVGLVVLAHINTSEVSAKLEAQKEADMKDIVAARIEPPATINVGEVPQQVASAAPAQESAEPQSGDSVYQSACAACHTAGVAGAPKLGDATAWSDRLGKGVETLYDHAINGFQGEAGVMPAKGGNTALSDDAVRAAVDYMVDESQ